MALTCPCQTVSGCITRTHGAPHPTQTKLPPPAARPSKPAVTNRHTHSSHTSLHGSHSRALPPQRPGCNLRPSLTATAARAPVPSGPPSATPHQPTASPPWCNCDDRQAAPVARAPARPKQTDLETRLPQPGLTRGSAAGAHPVGRQLVHLGSCAVAALQPRARFASTRPPPARRPRARGAPAANLQDLVDGLHEVFLGHGADDGVHALAVLE